LVFGIANFFHIGTSDFKVAVRVKGRLFASDFIFMIVKSYTFAIVQARGTSNECMGGTVGAVTGLS